MRINHLAVIRQGISACFIVKFIRNYKAKRYSEMVLLKRVRQLIFIQLNHILSPGTVIICT